MWAFLRHPLTVALIGVAITGGACAIRRPAVAGAAEGVGHSGQLSNADGPW
jgi:hypothetical protein